MVIFGLVVVVYIGLFIYVLVMYGFLVCVVLNLLLIRFFCGLMDLIVVVYLMVLLFVILLVMIVVVFDNFGLKKLVVGLVLFLGVMINMDGIVFYLGIFVFFIV